MKHAARSEERSDWSSIEEGERMTTEDNKALLRRHYQEIWSAGDLDTILQRVDETVAADYIDHNPTPGQPPGLAGLKHLLRGLHTGFPDMQTTVENMVAEGDQVVAYWRFRGTNTGPLAFMGLPASGRPVEMTGMDM